jgi:hypothetical protein
LQGATNVSHCRLYRHMANRKWKRNCEVCGRSLSRAIWRQNCGIRWRHWIKSHNMPVRLITWLKFETVKPLTPQIQVRNLTVWASALGPKMKKEKVNSVFCSLDIEFGFNNCRSREQEETLQGIIFFNPVRTKLYQSDLMSQSVPRSKHCPGYKNR